MKFADIRRLALAGAAMILGAVALAATPASAERNAESITPPYEGTPIIPGYWESRNKVLMAGITWSDKVERRCFQTKDVEKVMAGPSNRHYKCEYPIKNFDDGKVEFKGTCRDKKGHVISVKVQGTYTPTSFKMGAALATKLGFVPLSGGATTEAHRISDVCPPKTTFD